MITQTITVLSDGHSPNITGPHTGVQSLTTGCSEAARDQHMFTFSSDSCSVIHLQKFYDQNLKPIFLFRITRTYLQC